MDIVSNNQEHIQTNSATHSVSTRPTANLSFFQKSAYYAGIKIFNSLPSDLRSRMNKRHN